MYHSFVDDIRLLIFQQQQQCGGGGGNNNTLPVWATRRLQEFPPAEAASSPPRNHVTDVRIPPSLMFHHPNTAEYSAWDADGLPTHTTTGEVVSKSALKKLRKVQAAHAKKYEAHKQQEDAVCEGEHEAAELVVMEDEVDWNAVLDPSFCTIVAGRFGYRQGLELTSDMGPFCHVLQI